MDIGGFECSAICKKKLRTEIGYGTAGTAVDPGNERTDGTSPRGGGFSIRTTGGAP
jgi:hypothetical protein